MNLTERHRRLLADVLAIGAPYPLVITGGYAVQAHGLVDRLSQDLDVATENPAPIDEIIRTVGDGLAERGWDVRHIESSPLSGRLITTDRATGETCEVDVLKEAFWAPPTVTEYGPVLALDDVIGTTVRALADRGAVRDLIDVHAAMRHRSTADLGTWAPGHLGTWAPGHLGTWAPGHLGTWAPGMVHRPQHPPPPGRRRQRVTEWRTRCMPCRPARGCPAEIS
ncbi:nucleotidyl transferase AbiEii/AbiGii toxin family protein [Streptomyces clavuligerus]|uniref:nucleotidyl transferase AbiEii/AbiGii toxin family protein n=1 Tax=Streptomyces clavuligerus TaxID=1901 RepID=UPI0027DD233B|nr:nucleotidyl transferase AbiEii/AbiGii toxin family protein [Streptomyces clavuligerus]